MLFAFSRDFPVFVADEVCFLFHSWGGRWFVCVGFVYSDRGMRVFFDEAFPGFSFFFFGGFLVFRFLYLCPG